MVQITWLDTNDPFPDVRQALPQGLLAVGADLSIERLSQAYRQGIFPWFNPEDPILWWCPDPRMVLATHEFRCSHSLAKKIRQVARRERQAGATVRITMNTAFADVIHACAEARHPHGQTWISPDMQAAYIAWHQAGGTHSIETWVDGQLAGGLYGVSVGRFFFGESMFSRRTDASKLALAYLITFLERHGVRHIDCQQETSHLASLGAQPIPRATFLKILEDAAGQPTPPWQTGQLLADGSVVDARRPALATEASP